MTTSTSLMTLALLSVAAMGVLGTNAAMAAPTDDSQARLLTDFGETAPLRWFTMNDNVMGGRSRGGFQVEAGVLLFSGSTNTNGGGFSSIRTRATPLNLSAFDGVRLRLKADGRRYTFRLTTSTSQSRRAPTYWAEFDTETGATWQTIEVPFTRFSPRWRGRKLNGPALDLANVNSLGLMIYDKLDGAFRMEVDAIHAYRAKPVRTLDDYQWKKRPLLVFAPTASDARLVRQLADVQNQRAGFDERDLLLVVVTPNGSRIEQQVLDSRAVEVLRSRFRIPAAAFAVRLVGKDGSIKRMSHDVDPLVDIFKQVDSMPMRKAEIQSKADE